MDQGSSSADHADIMTRLAQLEAQVFEQDRVIAEQRLIIEEQRATIFTLREALDTSHEQITLLKKRLFAAKRERFISSPDQKLLFETLPLEPLPPVAIPKLESSAAESRENRGETSCFLISCRSFVTSINSMKPNASAVAVAKRERSSTHSSRSKLKSIHRKHASKSMCDTRMRVQNAATESK